MNPPSTSIRLDLYSARQRGAFTKQAAEELGSRKRLCAAILPVLLSWRVAGRADQRGRSHEGAGRSRSATRRPTRWSCCAIRASLERHRRRLRTVRYRRRSETTSSSAIWGVCSRHLDTPPCGDRAVVVRRCKARSWRRCSRFLPDEQRVHIAMTGQSLFLHARPTSRTRCCHRRRGGRTQRVLSLEAVAE